MHFGGKLMYKKQTARIITSKASLYKKLNQLNFKKEIILEKGEFSHIDRILKNINFKQCCIIKEKVSKDKIILKKINPILLNVFLKKNRLNK
jgi:hypothetical protein